MNLIFKFLSLVIIRLLWVKIGNFLHLDYSVYLIAECLLDVACDKLAELIDKHKKIKD